MVDVGAAVLAESGAVGKLGREHFSRRDRSASSDRRELTPTQKTQKGFGINNTRILSSVRIVVLDYYRG